METLADLSSELQESLTAKQGQYSVPALPQIRSGSEKKHLKDGIAGINPYH